MFIDLSGFTSLTETLMKKGNQGAEELSLILNEIFEPLVGFVYERGGFIPHFAGDSFFALFPHNDPQSGGCFLNAAATAVEFFQKRSFSFGGFIIGLKIGLSYGEVEWGIAGHVNYGFYFRGAPIDQSAACQDKAKDKNYPIVLDSPALLHLADLVLDATEFEPGFFSLAPPASRLHSNRRELSLPPLQREVMLSFLPQEVVEFQQRGEFRTVVSVFLAFEGISERRILNRLINVLLEQITTFSGYLKEFDFGDKGSMVSCFFGAPVSFENNDNRALEFIYSLRQELQELMDTYGVKFRAGATMGMAYTGMVGGKERCQYAMVGNRVNLAARLMASARWGEVLVDGEISKNRHFIFQHHGDIQYKGIEGNIPTYRLETRSGEQAQAYTGPLIGRDAELNKLLDFASPLSLKRPAGIAFVFGEAGIGKSRLSYEARKETTEKQDVLWAYCPADQILRKPFNPFVYFLKNYFGQSSEDQASRNLERFESRYQNLFERLANIQGIEAQGLRDELVRTKSVLGALVGIVYLDSVWEQLDARGRYQNTIQAVVNLFCCEAMLQPLVIELEDAHWIDENSQELVVEFLRQINRFPIMLLVTSRFNDDGSHPPIFEIAQSRASNIPKLEIDLNALQSNFVRQFAESRLDGKITSEFLDLLLRSTNSNPFYLEQLLEYFAEQQLLEYQNHVWTVKDPNIQLSNSINAILTARIDRLSALAKETVKAAAVIGREFELPVLAELMLNHEEYLRHNGNALHLLQEQVQVAEKGQIWRAMTDLRYIFRHALLREAAYSMQLRATLQHLHRMIAEALERLYRDQLEDRYFDLAFHFEQGHVPEKTIFYLEKAGDFARSRFLNQQALEYYDKLLRLSEVQNNPNQKSQILLKKAKILELIGNWDACASSLKDAVSNSRKTQQTGLLGQAFNAFGRLLMLQGNYPQAMRQLQESIQIFERLHDKAGMAEALGNLGNLYFRQGKYPEAEQYFHQSIEMARQLEGFDLDAQIVANLGLTYMNRGNYEEGISCQLEHLALCEQQNDKSGMAVIDTYLGIVYLEKGSYQEALDSFQKGLALCNELGNKQLISIAIGNIGIVYERQGNYKQAMENYLKDLELCEELGDKQGTAIALGLIGQLLNIQGEFHRAIEYLQKDLMLCEELSYQKGIAKAVNTLGDIFFNLQQYARSLHFYNRAIEVTRQIKNKLVLGFSLVEKGTVLLETGDWPELHKVVQEAKDVAQELGNPDLNFEARLLAAKTQYALGKTTEARDMLLDLLQTTQGIDHEASLHYELFRVDPDNAESGDKALTLYRELYQATPRYLFKLRLEILEKLKANA